MRPILFTLLLTLPATVLAQREAPKIVSNPEPGIVMTAGDLSASPTTDEMVVDGYALLKLQVRLTRGGAATDIGCTCEESDDTTTWSKITKTAPNDAVTEFHPVYTTSATLNWTIRLDVTLFVYVRCTFSGTGATSNDLVTVTGRRGRGI